MFSIRPANCRFEHPGVNSNPFGAPSTNRFGALSSGSGGSGGNRDVASKYKITPENIKTDLADERPSWVFSSYGPGKDAPDQLFGGYPMEQSFEEMRLYFESRPTIEQAQQEVQSLYADCEARIQQAVNNIDAAIQFIADAENKHPNRNDICKQNTRDGGTNGIFGVGRTSGGFSNKPLSSAGNQNPFSTTQSNPFGAPAATTTNPFGAPAATTSSFGQPSSLGQKSNPFGGSTAFGQPSTIGSTGPSAFGQPSQLGATRPAFGQSSALGAKPNPFGTPSAGPSGFAQAAQQPPGFAAIAQQPSAFGQPSVLGSKPNPFGAPAANAFVQPAQNQNAQPVNPFGQPAQPSSGFGHPAASNPFAAATSSAPEQAMETAPAPAPAATVPNPFGQPASTGFGAPNSNPFGQPPTQAQAPVPAPASASAAAQVKGNPGNPYPPGSTKQHPRIASYTSRDMSGRLTMFKGLPVIYKEGKAGVRLPHGWRKIWFPDGPPGYYRDTEPPEPAKYDENIKTAYKAMGENGRFVGNMPEVPPMREDCVWDF